MKRKDERYPTLAGGLNRRDFLRAAGGFALATGAAWALGPDLLFPQDPAPRPPNVLLIVADDLGYADVGFHGCLDVPTPHVDSIAKGGVRFTNGYVSCPICAPTRAGLLTGRYQQRFGFEHNPGPEGYAAKNFGLPKSQKVLPERLKALGYATGMVGKWHVGFAPELQPTARGFDEFFGFLGGANNYLPSVRRGGRSPILRGTEPVEEKEYLTDAFGREAAAFVEKHRDHPFFLYLPFNAVHDPLEASPALAEKFAGIADPKRRTYATMLASMDDAVGRVLGKLREHAIEDDTLVFFISDNGGPTAQTTSRNDPFSGYKGQMLEGGIRIPFAMQWKKRLEPGRVVHDPVVSLDILPTVVAAAGGTLASEDSIDGVGLLPFLKGESGAPHDRLFWRMGQQHAARVGDWKLFCAPGRAPALYDLATDPGEKKDQAKEKPEKLKELQGAYDEWNVKNMPAQWVRQDDRNRTSADAFKKYDANEDGVVTPEELGNPRLFKRLDKDGDGRLTLEEVEEFLGSRRGGGGGEGK